jgi:N-acetylmuramoyl-L-alanine amidase
MKKLTVILDNGHGKETPGKRSPKWKDGSQLFEWEYTRKLATAIEKKLKSMGYDAVRIVKEDVDVALSTRAKRVNEICKKTPSIMFSIHCNAGKGKGFEVWSTEKKNNSDILADCFCSEFKKILPDRKLRGHKEKNWTVIAMSNCPCVLTENFFMDTEEECKWMLTDDAFNRIVDLHVNAALAYMKQAK